MAGTGAAAASSLAMSPAVVTLFLALLAVAAGAALAVAGVLAVVARRSPGAAELRAALLEPLRGPALVLAALVASVATLGSLYLSEGAGYPPCRLCWVQRGVMYPLAAGLWIAAAHRARGVARPARAWALAGAAVSTWHVLIERFPALEGSTACDPLNPCSIRWVEHLGVVTIPVMALAAFLLAAALLSIRPRPDAAEAPHDLTDRTEAAR
jgi:disulfide bond formation protein DsbB